MIYPVASVTPGRGQRYYGCARCGAEIPGGCYVIGAGSDDALTGVSVWADGTCDDGKPGLVCVHGCGDVPAMDDATAQHHATLRGEAPANPGVS